MVERGRGALGYFCIFVVTCGKFSAASILIVQNCFCNHPPKVHCSLPNVLIHRLLSCFTVFFHFSGKLYAGILLVKVLVERVDFVFVYFFECIVTKVQPEWPCLFVSGQGLFFDVLHDSFRHNAGNHGCGS